VNTQNGLAVRRVEGGNESEEMRSIVEGCGG
jgi:hypothetical protein